MQPGVGSAIDRYHGLADGNPDLFAVDIGQPGRAGVERPDIYGPFGKSPDLSY